MHFYYFLKLGHILFRYNIFVFIEHFICYFMSKKTELNGFTKIQYEFEHGKDFFNKKYIGVLHRCFFVYLSDRKLLSSQRNV